MRRKASFSTFVIFLLFCIFILGLSKFRYFNNSALGLDRITTFFGENFYSLFTKNSQSSVISKIQKQNLDLVKKLKDYNLLKGENNALKDQFQNSFSKTLNLSPATIIGFPSENYVINKGERDGVRAGQAVIINDMVIGKIVKTSSTISLVNLISNASFSTTAKDLETSALGVVKGLGNGELLLDNVLLSEKLNLQDIVVTKGDMNMENIGMPADLMLGKIVSIDKKPSALFQTAKIKSLVDFTRLSTVFVVLGLK